jgi:hypothetical protein
LATAIAGVSHGSLIAGEAALAATILVLLVFVMWRLAQCPKPEPRRIVPPIYWGRANEIALQVELTDGRVISSCAPRLAAMNARLVIPTGTERPESRKSPLVETFLRRS